jgi:prepilin-type N-terminal cleavage/methylation domain-containing protein
MVIGSLKLKNSKRAAGFSLVELAIVIIIIGILSGVAIPIYYKYVENSKRSEVMVTMRYVKNYLDIFHGLEQYYPLAPNWENVVGSDWNDVPNAGLRGTYFLSKYYDYKCVDGEEYRIRCYWDNGREANFWTNEKGDWSWEIPEEDW